MRWKTQANVNKAAVNALGDATDGNRQVLMVLIIIVTYISEQVAQLLARAF